MDKKLFDEYIKELTDKRENIESIECNLRYRIRRNSETETGDKIITGCEYKIRVVM